MDRVPRIAIGGLIFKNDMILLGKRRDEPDKGKWAIPGGKLMLNETLEEGLKREMLEETHLKVDVGKLLGITESISKKFHYIILDYECKIISGIMEPSSDTVDLKYFDINELDITVNDSSREFIYKIKHEKLPVSILKINNK